MLKLTLRETCAWICPEDIRRYRESIADLEAVLDCFGYPKESTFTPHIEPWCPVEVNGIFSGLHFEHLDCRLTGGGGGGGDSYSVTHFFHFQNNCLAMQNATYGANTFTPDKCAFMNPLVLTIDCVFVEWHEKTQKSENR